MATGDEKAGFQLTTSLSPNCVLTAVDSDLRASHCRLRGLTATGGGTQDVPANSVRIELHLPRERQHFWSPELTVDVCANGDATRLRGRFGAAPSLFSLYVAIVAVSLFAALVGSSFAYAQWMLGETPTALWTLPTSFIPVVLVFTASKIGRSGGREQMNELRGFLEASIERAVAER